MNLNRCAVAVGMTILLGVAGCTSNPTSSQSSSLTEVAALTVAFSGPDDDPQAVALAAFAEGLADATQGRVTVTVQADGVLGGQDSAVAAVSEGTVDMAVVSAAALAPYNEDFSLLALPYVFRSPEAQAAVLADDSVKASLLTSLEESRSLTTLAGLYGGTRSIYNAQHPIVTPDDMDGLAIRVDSSQATVSMIQEMGGVAVPLALDEVVDGLTNGTIDGAENTPRAYVALNHEAKATYFSYTRHLMVPDIFVINTGRLNALDARDRSALADLLPALRDQANSGLLAAEADAESEAAEAGTLFNDDVDIAAFAERTANQREEFLTNPVRVSLYQVTQTANDAFPTP